MRLFGKKDKKEKDCTCGGNCEPVNNKEVKETSCCDVDYSSENMEKTEEKKKEKEIKILGSGCSKCAALEKSTREALAELNVEENIDHITDFSQIASYGVMSTPALVINGKVVSYGKVLNKDEVKDLLEQNGINKMRKPKVAFICVHNSCRSQIAEALGKKYASDVFDSYSAGTKLNNQINQDVVRIVKKLYGIDMNANGYHSKLIDEIPNPDIVISMGCDVGYPFIGRAFDDDWGLLDPTEKSDEVLIAVIKEIKDKIIQLKNSLKQQQSVTM